MRVVKSCDICGKRLDECDYVLKDGDKLIGSCCWKKVKWRNWIPVKSEAGHDLIYEWHHKG